MSLSQMEQDKNNGLSKIAALEQQVQAMQRSAASQLQVQREAEAKALELEAQLSGKSSELRAVQQSHALCHQAKCAVDEELGRARERMQADAEQHAQEQTSLRMRLEAERDQALQSAHEAQARLHSELESARTEHSRKLQVEVDANAKLREEIRVCRQEVERVGELRRREIGEHEHKAAHAAELHRASITRMESQMAAAASAAGLELQRAKKELADERKLTQEIVTEAKAEAATAMQQVLGAREDALRWQRAMERPALPTAPTTTATSSHNLSMPPWSARGVGAARGTAASLPPASSRFRGLGY